MMTSFNIEKITTRGEPVVGSGLLLHSVAKDHKDEWFESKGNLAPIHGNVYIDSDKHGVTKLSGKIADIIDDLWLIFERATDEKSGVLGSERNESPSYPFEQVELVLNGKCVWQITSNCLQMLEASTTGYSKSKDLLQRVIKLPLWLSKEYNQTLAVPSKFEGPRSLPYRSYGVDIECHVKTTRSYTLGAHIGILSADQRRKIIPRDVPIDTWHNETVYTTLDEVKIEYIAEVAQETDEAYNPLLCI